MISELIIFCTLLINAGAVLNFKLKKQKSVSFDDDDSSNGVGERVREFLYNLRYFRVFIAMWNIFIIVCMFLFFSG
ncbi:PREDICTED: small integral membrane protein 7-like [Amphimedon queenslandica]|uniref:Small integral membrane protein 7 n=1 Tax=Amphimedon queenslandica TaxID=400682 RepID=A0A1X7V174_AMPQE|nr:PREDICTED: small integral membrane protein 7-like [Amphimedon queenslandica]|eukprot:XP_003386212.1 PREDICTED: small integral membrane protein 7-like [Amphimedon queenslandica]